MAFKFPLGALVKDQLSGYKGIIVSRQEWLFGCYRYTVQAARRLKTTGEPIKAIGCDEGQLVQIGEGLMKEASEFLAQASATGPDRGGPCEAGERHGHATSVQGDA